MADKVRAFPASGSGAESIQHAKLLGAFLLGIAATLIVEVVCLAMMN